MKRLKTLEHELYIEQGTPLDGGLRMLIFLGRGTKVIDERPFRLIQRFIRIAPAEMRPKPSQLKEAFRRQLFILYLDEERAINALPKLLPEMDQRRVALELVYRIATATGDMNDSQKERFRRIEEILGVTVPGDKEREPGENAKPMRTPKSRQ